MDFVLEGSRVLGPWRSRGLSTQNPKVTGHLNCLPTAETIQSATRQAAPNGGVEHLWAMPKRKKPIVRKRVLPKRKPSPAALLKDLTALIEEARSSAAREVNTVLVALYWRVGQRLRDEVIGEGRAEYGEQIVSAVGRQLSREYGAGFSEKGLRHMMRFVDTFPDERIVSALGRQLVAWSRKRSEP